ncbi:MAG: serine/threonine protein kinase [Deltaproteobacteria bacterium]|nr:serine/threonine protein kinase [Deltaproteobacteria bacterium]
MTDALVGATIDRDYQVVRWINTGGMGTLYEARHLWTGQTVAVKLIHVDFVGEASFESRFLREAQAAARVQHPNVVRVLDMGRDEPSDRLYIVLEYLQGQDLEQILARKRSLPMADAVELLVPVMAGLIAVHRSGVVHRDIKPDNIFLARSQSGAVTPKLVDFGAVKILHGTADLRHPTWRWRSGEGLRPTARVTQRGRPFGTPAYMSPEQTLGDSGIDPQTDVWAMGVVLYQCLSGRLPFPFDPRSDPDFVDLFRRIRADAPPRLDRIAPQVPKAVGKCVHRALEKDRGRRYQNVQNLLGDLLDCDAVPLRQRWRTSPMLVHWSRELPDLVPASIPARGPDDAHLVLAASGAPLVPEAIKPAASLPALAAKAPSAPAARAPERPSADEAETAERDPNGDRETNRLPSAAGVR